MRAGHGQGTCARDTAVMTDRSGLTTAPTSHAKHRHRATDESKTRTTLLDAAETILLEDGYASVTSRRVAERAGVNAALVYHYFDSMDGLFVELFRRGA